MEMKEMKCLRANTLHGRDPADGAFPSLFPTHRSSSTPKEYCFQKSRFILVELDWKGCVLSVKAHSPKVTALLIHTLAQDRLLFPSFNIICVFHVENGAI
jgi:hypothetical protein